MITDKIYAIIPARSGSKSVPDKNIRLLGGKPLMAYSIAVARQIPEIDRVIVSTDSMEYAQISRVQGAEAPFLRPRAISGDMSTDSEWVCHLLAWLWDNEKELPKYLIHLRPTQPLRDLKYIREAINVIEQHPEATALRSVNDVNLSIHKHCEIENGFLRPVGSKSFDLDLVSLPRQSLPKIYVPNSYVDILKTSFIVQHNGEILGNKVIPFYTPGISDIDTEDDWKYLEYTIWRDPETYRRIFEVQ